MAHITIVLNKVTLLDADLTEYVQTPPPELERLLHPTQSQPWSKYVGGMVIDAMLTNTPTDITVRTNHIGYVISVSRKNPPTSSS